MFYNSHAMIFFAAYTCIMESINHANLRSISCFKFTMEFTCNLKIKIKRAVNDGKEDLYTTELQLFLSNQFQKEF